MIANWAHIGPVMTAAFLASLVEAVEALTIVLAVAAVRGWRPAGLGAIAGLFSLAAIVAALGPLLDRVPLHLLQLAIGILLLLFGMRWLRKAIRRSAGVIPLHDEATAFAAEKTITLTVKNMYCADCSFIVRKSLESVPGVSKVAVSYKDKTAVVTYDDGTTDVPALTRATTDAGYPSTPRS